MPLCPRTLTTLTTSVVLFGGALAPAALAQQDEQPVLIAFSSAGTDAWFSDPNDANLQKALGMIVPRFMELRASEAPFARDLREIPDEVIQSVASLIGAPMHFVVMGGQGFDERTNMPDISVMLSFDMEQGEAETMHGTLRQLLQMSGGPEPVQNERFATMQQLDSPAGPVMFGPRQSNDGWHYEILFGAQVEPDMMRTVMPVAPGEGRQLAAGVFDLQAMTPLTEMGLSFLESTPMGEQAIEQIRSAGIVGEGAMRMEMTSWTDGTTTTTEAITRRARNFRESMNLPASTLTPADMAIIPADATAAAIYKFSPEMMMNTTIDQVAMSQPEAREQIDELMAMIEEQTGIDVMGEFVPALGDTVAMYFADSTGGGSLMSGVVAIKSSDKRKLREMFTSLENQAAAMIAGELDREGMATTFGFRPVRSRYNGNPMVTYRAAGLPLPIAPSMTIIGDWFVMGMTPQAAMGAAERTGRANGRGLLDNPRFMAAYNAQPETVSVAFIDTQRTMNDGLATMNLLTTVLGNLVTSPNGEQEAIGSIMPSLGTMWDNPQPFIQQSFWVGDDLVQRTTNDASMLVSMAGVLGVGDAAPLIGGIAIGAGLGSAIAENAGGYGGEWEDQQWDDDWDDDWEDEDWDDEEVDSDSEY